MILSAKDDDDFEDDDKDDDKDDFEDLILVESM